VTRPLDGIRVLDVSDSIGAYCTKLLAGLGAEVVKIECPEGDELRRRPPFHDGVSGTEASLVFAYYHAGKRGITLDTRRAESVPALVALGADADVVVMSPSRRRPLAGFDEDTLTVSWARPDAVVCSITPFGLTGPYRHRRATHFVAYATGASMHRIGTPEGPPLTIPGQQHFDEAGAHAAVCILAALQNFAAVGGQTIDISANEVAATKDFVFDRYEMTGMTLDRSSAIGYPPTGTWQCKDGPFDVAAHQTRHWTAFLRMLDDPPELSDPSLNDVLVRREIYDGLAETISGLLADRSRYEMVVLGQAAGLPCSILNTPGEFVEDEQLAARDYFVTLHGADGRDVRMPGAPFRSTPELFSVGRAAPCLGEHDAESFEFSEIREPLPSQTGGLGRTIDQLRVLTFGSFIAGNTTGLILAELGADVVKIEALARPEVLRNPAYAFGPTLAVEPSGVPNTVMYGGLSRSTRNVSLEMNTEEGRALFRRLVAVSDVVIENFGAETMPHWDCSFDDLLAVNPRLVMVSLSGYGRTGPRSSYLAYATNISNFSGLTSAWQYQHGTHSDYIAAVHAAVGALAAIAQSDRTDSGVYIDVAQTEALAAVMAPIYLDPLNNGRDTPPTGNAVPGSLFTGAFACQGHDRWLAIELEDVSDWSTLCTALDRPDLAIADETEAESRRAQLADAIAEWAEARSPHTAAQLLQRIGLAAGAVYDNEDAVRDPQLRARGASVEIDQPDLGVIEYYQSAHRMTKTPGYVRRRGPRLGEHTCEVLQEWLSLDAKEISVLEAADAVWQAPTDAPIDEEVGAR
jgi:crotonobetainyl-CoA:carnitine CoA-transferase CaiB-like acyl-CoA transferase